jgi:asparagine synthase (glutamine-hydrolysing)
MYLRQQLLRDADVMSMAHGLEVRVPFVDHRMVSTVWPALGGHPELLDKKRLLVESLGAVLPEEIVQRPKQGFTLPFEHWLDGPLASFVRDGVAYAAAGGWIAESTPSQVHRDWQARACHWSRPWGLAILGHMVRHV